MGACRLVMQKLGFDLPGVAGNVLTRFWMLQRTYNWQLILPHNINGISGILLSQYCQDVKFGDYSIGELSVMRYGSQQRFYAGLQEIEVAELIFIMPIDNSVYNYFRGWRKLIIDDNGYYYPKNHYKKDIFIFMFDRSGVQSGKFVLKGVFPKTCPPISLSYSDEGVLKWGLELSVDRIETSSLIGSISEGITNLLGDVGKKTSNMFGDEGKDLVNAVTDTAKKIFG